MRQCALLRHQLFVSALIAQLYKVVLELPYAALELCYALAERFQLNRWTGWLLRHLLPRPLPL